MSCIICYTVEQQADVHMPPSQSHQQPQFQAAQSPSPHQQTPQPLPMQTSLQAKPQPANRSTQQRVEEPVVKQAEAAVATRVGQLDDMLLECRQFEEMHAGFERWYTPFDDDFQRSSATLGNTVEKLEGQMYDFRVSVMTNRVQFPR